MGLLPANEHILDLEAFVSKSLFKNSKREQFCKILLHSEGQIF